MRKTVTDREREIAEHYNRTGDVSDFVGGDEEPVEVRRNVTISVRFSAAEIELLRNRAEAAGTKVTAFIRAAALNAEQTQPDLAALAEATAAVEQHLHDLRESLGIGVSHGAPAGKFEVFEDRTGRFRWRLKAANGEIIATGEAYQTREAALEGIDAMQRVLVGASVPRILGRA